MGEDDEICCEFWDGDEVIYRGSFYPNKGDWVNVDGRLYVVAQVRWIARPDDVADCGVMLSKIPLRWLQV